MNKTFLIGRLTADPEIRATQKGTTVANFRLAVNRRSKQENAPRADFLPVVAWGRLAEIVGEYCQKGRQVAIFGRIEARTWQGQDGTNRYTTEIIAEELELLARPASSESAPPTQTQEPEPIPDGFFVIDNDLPF